MPCLFSLPYTYRVDYETRSVCYITDNELYPASHPLYNQDYRDKLIEFVKKSDYLIIDSTYTEQEYEVKVGWGHTSVSQVEELADDGLIKTLCLFHHDPDQKDADIDAKLQTVRTLLEKKKSATRCLAPKETQCFRI